MLKWIGAVFVLAACGGWGFYAAWQMRRQEIQLRQLSQALDYLACELSCRQSPLPELLSAAAKAVGGTVGDLLEALSAQLLCQEYSDAACCMEAVLNRYQPPVQTERLLLLLGSSLGRFDLSGQQAALAAVQAECRRILESYCAGLDQRMRSYRILGFCAGGALAILLL